MERGTHDIHNLIEKYLDHSISEDDRLELIRLVRLGYAEEFLKDKIGETFRDELLREEKPTKREISRAKEILEEILGDEKPSYNKSFASFVQYAASLLIVGIAGLMLYFQRPSDRVSVEPLAVASAGMMTTANNSQQIQKVELSDGSIVSLEPGGELRYPEKFGQTREVFLSGEAFFEITKDAAHPFLVYANEVTTKVLGTSFRVTANKEAQEIVVAVKTGKVSVSAKSSNSKFRDTSLDEVTLTPNQQAIYDRNEHVVVKKVVEKPVVVAEEAVIKNNYINEQVVQILEALSARYAVDIRYDAEALSECTLTSDVIDSEGLFDQLDIICSALGGSYRLENDASIMIESNGCKNVKP
jgi:hypothetical protein